MLGYSQGEDIKKLSLDATQCSFLHLSCSGGHFESTIQSGIFICVKTASQPTSQYLVSRRVKSRSLLSKNLYKAA